MTLAVPTTAELLQAVQGLDAEARAALDAFLMMADPSVWVPQAGPQSMAYHSPADVVFYGGSAGGGKGLALDTPLPTPTGWTTMGELQVGDCVLAPDGAPCRVVGVSPVQQRECFRLRFDDGAELVADDVHRWVTFSAAELSSLTRMAPDWRAKRRASRPSRIGGNKSPAFTAALIERNKARAAAHVPDVPRGTMRDTATLAATLRSASGRANHAIAINEPIQLPESDLPIPPYTLGAWLGHGASASAQITARDLEVIDRIRADGFEVRSYSWADNQHNIIGLMPALRAAGQLKNKHVPASYLRASAGQRLEFLRGLMDTDGYVAPDGGAEFNSTHEGIACGVLELARSLGIKATMHKGQAKLNGICMGEKWRVLFTTTVPVFTLPRQLGRMKKQTRRTTSFRYLVDCSAIESVPTRCISVDSPSRQFLAGDAMVATHNTDLLLGLALTSQEQSIIFRREAVQLIGLEERMTQILGSRDGYNGQDHLWRLPGKKILEFGSVQKAGDWKKYQGRPHDLKGFDEITHFTESQFRTLIAWKRTGNAGVRQRVVCAGNPPTEPSGEWVKRYWAAWLDPQHPNPAKPGELRWYISNDRGEDLEVPNNSPVMVNGEMVVPTSRTFIPSRVDDNLFLTTTGYKATLQALPEPLRSQMLRGDFNAGTSDPVWQLIPTEWVKAAQARWRERDTKGLMTAMGFDPSRGGQDKSSAARRHRQWFDKIITAPGVVTKDGPSAAGFVAPLIRDGAVVCIDSIGIGSSALDFITGLGLHVHAVVGSEGSALMDKSGQLRFRNKRAEYYWLLREALDPTNPDPIALPPDQELLGDLTAPRYKVVTMGRSAAILVSSKDDIRLVLGRSPDKGDAVAMTFAADIPKPEPKPKAKSWRDRLAASGSDHWDQATA
ncbi:MULTISPECIES: LAGLIDADG family homing endonuclease [unclassified Acidovorax]|uniref:LAGLIDADG family homing endonuclease n=1 Tax=unclassified Acidovorax TaxID=2684926 RepID=UPI002883215D|nr:MULTISPECIES: LAGLIDADG family homing endonuclease [unclassified Acidovorax]